MKFKLLLVEVIAKASREYTTLIGFSYVVNSSFTDKPASMVQRV